MPGLEPERSSRGNRLKGGALDAEEQGSKNGRDCDTHRGNN